MSFGKFNEEGTLKPVNFKDCLQPARPISDHELPYALRVSGESYLRVLNAIGPGKKEILDTKN